MAINVDLTFLDRLSFKTNLGRSLARKRLSDVNLSWLFTHDIFPYIDRLNTLGVLPYEVRIKSKESCYRKVRRYQDTSKSLRDVFNDVLGFRLVVDSYSDLNLAFPSECYKVDRFIFDGSKNGYRGIHYYYQRSNKHYKIEIQVNTPKDRLFADWCHKYVYKQFGSKENTLGLELRKRFDSGKIKTERDFYICLQSLLKSYR